MKHVLALLVIAPLGAQTLEQLEAHGALACEHDLSGETGGSRGCAPNAPNGEAYALVKGSRFRNGTIDVELAGKPAAGAGPARAGLSAWRFGCKEEPHEYIYLRPTNGRADDQVRRNHSTQYGAHPDFGFDRSRKESPEKYESYVDLEPGVWTKYRIVVDGTKARLFVHGAAQPCLIVNDMKLGDSEGAVALWVGPGTEGYFANLKRSRRESQKKLHNDLVISCPSIRTCRVQAAASREIRIAVEGLREETRERTWIPT